MLGVVLRGVLALALLATAAVHLERWLIGYRDIPTIGPMFLANVVAGVLLAGAVLLLRHRLVPLAAAGFGAATLGAFVLSRTVGLFGPPTPFLGEPPEIVSVVAELTCVVLGLTLATRRPSRA